MSIPQQLTGRYVDTWLYINTATLWSPNTYARNAGNKGFSLPPTMKFAHKPLHLVSVDEQRKEFAVTDLQGSRQIGFKGVHSDVGGGYGGRFFEYITLRHVYEDQRAMGLNLFNEATIFEKLPSDDASMEDKWGQLYRRLRSGELKSKLTGPSHTAYDNSQGIYNDQEPRHLPRGLAMDPSVSWFEESPKNRIP